MWMLDLGDRFDLRVPRHDVDSSGGDMVGILSMWFTSLSFPVDVGDLAACVHHFDREHTPISSIDSAQWLDTTT